MPAQNVGAKYNRHPSWVGPTDYYWRVLTRLVVEELGLGPPNWFGGVGLLSPPEKEKPIYHSIPYYLPFHSDPLHDTKSEMFIFLSFMFANFVARKPDQTRMFTED